MTWLEGLRECLNEQRCERKGCKGTADLWIIADGGWRRVCSEHGDKARTWKLRIA